MINSIGLKSYNTYANFILVEVREQNKKKKIISELLKKRIIIRDLDNYGLKHFFRVSIGTDSQMNVFRRSIKINYEKIMRDLKFKEITIIGPGLIGHH